MKVKKIIGVIIFAALVVAGYGQENQVKTKESKKRQKIEKRNQIMRLEEEGVPSFRKQNAFGIKLNTDGWGLSYEFGHSNSVTRATIYQIEFNEKKHRKEYKQNRQTYDQNTGFLFFGNPFVFGKENIFYQLKGAVGQQILIGGKGNKNGVSVYGIGAGGVSLGFMRPYYVEAQDTDNKDRYIKYNSPDSLLFLTPEYIIGGAGISKGWNEMKLAPGLHAKTAIRFDYNRFNTVLSGIEGGLNVEYYFKDIQQMVYSPSRKFFFNAYVSILFGKRK